VNENVSQVTVVAGTITQEIALVSAAADEITESSSNVNSSSSDLLRMANALKQVVGSFKI
jgi:methyl-accepting chemotaxis protein